MAETFHTHSVFVSPFKDDRTIWQDYTGTFRFIMEVTLIQHEIFGKAQNSKYEYLYAYMCVSVWERETWKEREKSYSICLKILGYQ